MTNGWGKPESAVLDRANRLRAENTKAAIATLVEVEGSAYRRPGAKLLVTHDGEGTGAITAGCLANELARLSKSVIESGNTRLDSFDLQREDDSIGLGIGCNGSVEILIEPLDDSYATALSAYASRERGSLLTVLEGAKEELGGERGWYHEVDGFEPVRGEWPSWLQGQVIERASERAERGGAETIQIEGPHGSVRVYIDGIVPPPRLLVIGTGNDVPPLVKMGSYAGFEVSVVGYRSENAVKDAFSAASSVHATTPRDLSDVVEIGDDTYCVVMTHNFADDQVTIERLLETPSPYIGIVSSKSRARNLITAIKDDTSDSTPIEQNRIYAPIGLDLGGGAPSQIALSIVSEVMSVCNERSPGHLRDQQNPIHERSK